MPNMRSIKTHIKSVTNTQQITKAMKMVAASKLRKVQGSMQVMRPFVRANKDMLDALLDAGAGDENAYIKPKAQVKKVSYYLMVGNRGLYGMYNTSILKYMEEIAAKETRPYEVVVVGRWGRDVIRKSGLPIYITIDDFNDAPTMGEALELAENIKKKYLSDRVDEIYLVYQSFVSALTQKPVCKQLLPVRRMEKEEVRNIQEFEFIPDENSVLEGVIDLYLNNKIYMAMLEARCSEHSARMTAMSAATDSTKELLGELNLSLNRARQAAITTEISEIVGGASALKNKKQM